MKIKLNLIENAHDFLSNSLDLYKEADEYGMHDEDRSNYIKKAKWKLALITIIQALELLMKEILRRINPNLIYENIDSEQFNQAKTVSFSQAIIRVNNMAEKLIPEKEFLQNCLKLRKQFIHYEVDITSEEIKSKYCKLFSLYIEIYNLFLNEDVQYISERHKSDALEVLLFNKEYTVFRGFDISKDKLDILKKDIEENELYHYYITNDGKKVKRIRYGEEKEYYKNFKPDYSYYDEDIKRILLEEEYQREFCEFFYCGDCAAKKGEYHLDGCDLEVCPVCGQQLLSCNCIVEMVSD